MATLEKYIDGLVEMEEEYNFNPKAKRRKTRRANSKKEPERAALSPNRWLGPKTTKALKKAQHRARRRRKDLCWETSKGYDTSLKAVLWELT